MKKSIITFVLLFICTLVYTQTGIGRKAPRGSIDVNNANGTNSSGIVLPTTDDVSKIVNPQGGSIVPGTLIYDSKNDCLRYFIAETNSWSECLSFSPKIPTPNFTTSCTGFSINNFDATTITGTVDNVPVTATITKNPNVVLETNTGTRGCGIPTGKYWIKSGTFTIRFNKPVTNLKVFQTYSNAGERITISTKKNNQTAKNTSIVPAQISCNNTLLITDLEVFDNHPTKTFEQSNSYVYTITGDWFDEITFNHNGEMSGSTFEFCVGNAREK